MLLRRLVNALWSDRAWHGRSIRISAMSNIWVIVYCNEGMSQGDVYMHRLLRGDDIIDAKIYANEVAESLNLETREDHSMPSIKHYPVHIWTGQSFYFRR